jgi:hypothetical protein
LKDADARTGGPFRLTTPGEARWTRFVPWPVVVPLAAIAVYLLASGPLSAQRVVPALGVALSALVACAGAIASFTPGTRAWTRRIAVVTPEGLTVLRPGCEPFQIAYDELGRLRTHVESTGPRFPPLVQLVTEVYHIDGRRLPELTVHHLTYRFILRTTDLNPDGPGFLRALEENRVLLDGASSALVESTFRAEDSGVDGVSELAVTEARAGRPWHALKAAKQDSRVSERTSALHVRLSLVLGDKALPTARAGLEDHPGQAVFAYYLAHALLSDVGVAKDPTPVMLAHRSRTRAEARALLEGLVGDAEYGARAARDVAELWHDYEPEEAGPEGATGEDDRGAATGEEDRGGATGEEDRGGATGEEDRGGATGEEAPQ